MEDSRKNWLEMTKAERLKFINQNKDLTNQAIADLLVNATKNSIVGFRTRNAAALELGSHQHKGAKQRSKDEMDFRDRAAIAALSVVGPYANIYMPADAAIKAFDVAEAMVKERRLRDVGLKGAPSK